MPPTAGLSGPPADGVFDVDLDNLTGHDVSVAVDDDTGSVVDVTSGRPGDGMSVRWFDLEVENIDAETLRIVWVGLPRDEVVRLGISRVDDKVRLRFVQDGPPADSDAIGFDRVLKIKFVGPVRAEDILATIRESLDTQTDLGRNLSTPGAISAPGTYVPRSLLPRSRPHARPRLVANDGRVGSPGLRIRRTHRSKARPGGASSAR